MKILENTCKCNSVVKYYEYPTCFYLFLSFVQILHTGGKKKSVTVRHDFQGTAVTCF